jgi:hypothetical protein
MIEKGAKTATEPVNVTGRNIKARTKRPGGRWFARLASPFQTLSQFAQLATRSGRGLWLIPMMGVLAIVAVMLVVVQVIEYVAPFVYTIF